ncbi:AraC family transcriptional regulator [Paraburkholderia sp. WSM4174]
MHDAPDRSWRVEDLASVAGMLRSQFMASFRQTVGTTPSAYLTAWRLMLARRALANVARSRQLRSALVWAVRPRFLARICAPLDALRLRCASASCAQHTIHAHRRRRLFRGEMMLMRPRRAQTEPARAVGRRCHADAILYMHRMPASWGLP